MLDIFEAKSTKDYLNNEIISDRPNSGADQAKQNFNLIFNNAYQTISDFFKIRVDETDPSFLSRGILLQSDEIIFAKKDQEQPYAEIYHDDTLDLNYIHIYQNLYQEQEQSFDNNVYINGMLSVFDDDINNPGLLNGISFFAFYDENLVAQEDDNYILELIKFPQGGTKEYASLRVNNLYVEGDYTIINTTEMTVEDPLLTINQNTETPFLVRTQGIYAKEQQDDSLYAKFIFDVSDSKWKVLDKGFTDPLIEELSHLEVGDFTCNGVFNQGQITSNTIVFDPTFQFIDSIDGVQLTIDFQSTTITFEYDTLFTNAILAQEIYNPDGQFSIGQSLYDTTINQDTITLTSNSNIIDAGFIVFKEDQIEFDNTSIQIKNKVLGTNITLNITGDIIQSQGQLIGNDIDGVVQLLGEITLGTTGKNINIIGDMIFGSSVSILYDITANDIHALNTITSDHEIEVGDTTNTSIIQGPLTLSNVDNLTNILGSLQVQQQQSFGDDISINGDITQLGLNNTIGLATSVTVIPGELTLSSVGETTSILGDLDIQGSQTVGSISIVALTTQTLTLNSQGSTHVLEGSFTISGQQNTVTILQPTTISNNLTVSGDTIFGQDETQSQIIRGSLLLSSIGEDTTVLGDLSIGGTTTFTGLADFNGNITMDGPANTLTVYSIPTFHGQQQFNNNVSVSNTLTSYNVTVTNVLRIGDIEITYDPIGGELVYTHV